MGHLEELEEENHRLKADRRASDEQNWRTLFSKVDEINRSCAGCQAKISGLNQGVLDLQKTVYGVQEAPGMKGHLAELQKESKQVKWLLGTVTVATIAALAEKIVEWGGKLFGR
jgi:hypothetical protein